MALIESTEFSMLKRFAERHRLRIRMDDDALPVIPGRDGQVYQHGPGRLAVMLTHNGEMTSGTKQRWSYRRRACIEVAMVCIQDGDDEGTCVFDPENDEQAQVAIRVARIKRRRLPSEAQLAVLARARDASPLMRQGLASAYEHDGGGKGERGKPPFGGVAPRASLVTFDPGLRSL